MGFPTIIALLVLAGFATGMTGAGSQRPAEIAVLDRTGVVGANTAVAIGADGRGLISYFDETNLDLKVAHCSNAACGRATVSTIDRGTTGQRMVGLYTSVALGADKLGLISYYDIDATALKVAHCSNAACSAASLSTLDERLDVGLWTSVAIGADGLGLISYWDQWNRDLKVAHCSNETCSAATVSTLDSSGRVGAYTSVAIGADGLGLISYWDETNGNLKVAHCSNAACTRATVSTLDRGANGGRDNVGRWTSIELGADGRGLISYWDETNGNLKVAHCSNALCTGATASTLDSGANGGRDNVGEHTSVTRGRDGLGLISYFDETNQDLKVARCSNTLCNRAAVSTLDSTGRVGRWTSIALGADRRGLIAYYDGDNGDLKAAHCVGADCGAR